MIILDDYFRPENNGSDLSAVEICDLIVTLEICEMGELREK